MQVIKGELRTLSPPYNGGWRFGTLEPDISIVGAIPDFRPGDLLVCSGKWKQHQKYGPQFMVETCEMEIPRDQAGIAAYLDRHFKWVGPVLSRKLVDRFGETLFHVIEHNPEQLAVVSGITPQRAADIHQEYLSIKADQELDTFFAANGITMGLRNKLTDHYGGKQQAIEAIKENPYALAEEIFGIGFKKADAIALRTGIKKDSRRRTTAGLRWILLEASTGEGHCFLPAVELYRRCREILQVSDERITAAIERQVAAEGVIVTPNQEIYHADLYRAEQAVAAKLRELASAPEDTSRHVISPADAAELDADQQLALINALANKISVITGGPGVGKTYTLNYILRALGEDCNIELAAPTGKASKRMSEATGIPARTIHRLLEYSPFSNSFSRGADNPLECDALIIDESSMIDVKLMASLMYAISANTKVIFTGDVDQLPPVGPGRCLADMIESGRIPVSRLTILHRQAKESLININAQRINAGRKLVIDPGKRDFFFIAEEEAEKIPELIVRCLQRIPGEFSLAAADIQVLCPQKRGPAGVENLNKVLRPYLNPHTANGKLPGVSFLRGDRVIQMKNNYKLEIFNGDIGEVTAADENYLYVIFDDLSGNRTVSYPLADIGELQLAYALTVHKSQGSEFPCVIMPVHTTNYMMLKRNLIYTGVTRGKKLVILIGQMKAANMAIRTVDTSKRWSRLAWMLKELTSFAE